MQGLLRLPASEQEASPAPAAVVPAPAKGGHDKGVTLKGMRGQHGEVGAEGTVTLRRPAHQVFAFLSTFERQPAWNPQVVSSAVVRQEPGGIKHVQQTMRWGFLALRGDFQLGLAVREDPRAMQVDTVMTDGAFMRRFSSSMAVTPTGPDSCSLCMRVYMQPAVCVPMGVKSLVGATVRRTLSQCLSSLKGHVEADDFEHGGQQAAPKLLGRWPAASWPRLLALISSPLMLAI